MDNQETPKAKKKTLKFKAEVAQLLDIVVNSLYTDREIFIRELISNASDALEKMRHLSLTKSEITGSDIPLEIRIESDEDSGTFAITDTGIGMTFDEAGTNLGTIAHSGSKEFIKKLSEGGEMDMSLIGQFGVGFYSAFMVSERVTVQTRSWEPAATGAIWSSEGKGSFNLREAEGITRGARILLTLKEDAKEFANADRIKDIIHKYSNFVPFPIFVNDDQVNTVGALWTKSKNEISDEDYKGFYQFVGNAHDDPTYRLHFAADAPLSIRAVLFVPGSNIEKMGLGKMDPGVHLYCRKVLIQSQAPDLLPEFFRFFRGVVDSEDIPLNISRETMQDSALIAKLRRVITKRLIKFLESEAKDDAEKFNKFFAEFGIMIKEGVWSDMEYRADLAKLLRFTSSKTEGDGLTSLDEYIERMPEDQKDIYYVLGGNRATIEAGPYLEAFRARDIEVLYLFDNADDFVMTSLREYEGKKLVPADQADIELPGEAKEEEDQPEEKLEEKDAGDLARWVKEALGEAIEEVRVSKRLVKSPAVLVNPDTMFTTGMQRVMQAVSKDSIPMSKMILEINPSHPILVHLNSLRLANPNDDFAKEASRLLLDNARISAGLAVDPRDMVERGNAILEHALKGMVDSK